MRTSGPGSLPVNTLSMLLLLHFKEKSLKSVLEFLQVRIVFQAETPSFIPINPTFMSVQFANKSTKKSSWQAMFGNQRWSENTNSTASIDLDRNRTTKRQKFAWNTRSTSTVLGQANNTPFSPGSGVLAATSSISFGTTGSSGTSRRPCLISF